MEVIYSDDTKRRPEEFKLLSEATEQLEQLIGASAARVKAEWDCFQDNTGNITYTLKITDWMGSATATFWRPELAKPLHMLVRLSRLWGDLIQVRIDKQLQKVAQDEA
jgi:hypothetical protein